MIKDLQTLNVAMSGTVSSGHNSMHIDQPGCANRSGNTVYPVGQTFLPFLDILQEQYLDDPVLSVIVPDHTQEHNSSLHPAFVCSNPCTLPQ